MAFLRSQEEAARHTPGLEVLTGWFRPQQPGRLVVRDVSDLTRVKVAAASLPSTSASGSAADGASAKASPLASLQIIPVDTALEDVPVPTVFLGGLPAPIPAGRPTIDADGLLRQLQQGQLPSDSLPEGDRDAWRAASRITDPISAYNICQAQRLGGRRVLVTERGVAEQLARGTIQMVPVQRDAGGGDRSGGGSGWTLPNPFAPLLKLASGLAESRELTSRVQSRAEALGGERRSGHSKGAGAADGSSARAPSKQQQEPGQDDTAAPAGARGLQGVQAVTFAEDHDSQEAPVQYCLQDLPARRLLAGGTPPQLAWVPLRVALQLLRTLPQHFVLLQGASQRRGPRGQQGGEAEATQQQRREGEGSDSNGGSSGGSGVAATGAGARVSGVFDARGSPADLDVWVIPGLHVRQVTPDGTSVDFAPAFISHDSAQDLWREVREISGGALLVYRRLERSLMRRRLEAAAAIIASGGLRRPSSPSSAQDEDDGGMEEPPEISEFIQELGGSLAQEAGGSLGAASGGGGPQPPSGALPRLVATFACGVVSLAAQGLSWAGNTADWLLMATPMGPRLLGVPESTLQRQRLSEVVSGMQQHNQEQAALQGMLSCLSTLHDLAQERLQQEAQEPPQGGAGEQQQAQVQGGASQQGQEQQLQDPAGQLEQQGAAQPSPAEPQAEERQGQQGQQPPALAAAQAPSASAAAGPGSEEGQDHERRRAAIQAAEAEALLLYRRRLAAAAIWVALLGKNVAEDPSAGGTSFGRLMAKTFLQQGSAMSAAALAGGGLHHRLQHQIALPSGAPSLGAEPFPEPASMQEAVEQVVLAGLPVLEHNGFQSLFSPDADTASSSGGSCGSGQNGASWDGDSRGHTSDAGSNLQAAGAASAALAQAVAAHCTADTHLGLGAFVRDGSTGGYRVLTSNPLAPPAVGRGLILVGDLDLAHRQRGRSAGRTAARWLTVGVDDGRQLL